MTKIIDVHTYCLWKRISLAMGIWDSVCLMSKEKREIKCQTLKKWYFLPLAERFSCLDDTKMYDSV